MPINILELPKEELEFQMFVLDELADMHLAQGNDVIKLTIGITELEIPEKVQEAFSKTLDDFEKTHQVYPEGVPALRKAISGFYQHKYQVESSPENVIINVGTSALFRNIAQIVCREGQEVLIPRPYYCLYLLSSILAGAKITYYDIDLETGKVDMESFKKNYNPDKTAIVIINTPGNPVGNIVTREDIIAINEIVDCNSYIINDEIYNNVNFYTEYQSPLSYLDEKYKSKNIITNSFSKGYRMYTKRVGFAILPDELVMPMRIIQQHTVLTCDPVNQYAMIEALKDEESPKELCELYKSRAEYTYEKLSGTGCKPLKSEGGFYIVLECTDWINKTGMANSKELAADILNSVYVAVVPGTDFGLPNGLRLSFCSARYNEAVDRLYEYFTK